MSATTEPQTIVCDNDNCEVDFVKGCGYKGHCSEECYSRRRGAKLLNLLKHDHRFCASDFKRLKTVSRPTDEQLRKVQGKHSAESIIGFQYRTKEAETGEITIRADVIDTVVKGTVCSCGATDHTDEYLRDVNPKEAAKRLRERVLETKKEGQHSYGFDTEAFVEAWNESHDWELSLGRALER